MCSFKVNDQDDLVRRLLVTVIIAVDSLVEKLNSRIVLNLIKELHIKTARCRSFLTVQL